jgi:uncharacterized membrane protein YhaH (DUF805 family)
MDMNWMLMPLRRYAEFSGRSRRMEFWMWVLFQFLIGLGIVVLAVILGGSALLSGDPRGMLAAGGVILILYIVNLLLQLAFFIPNLAVTVRRLHDTNRSGWWVMLFWGPYLLIVAMTIAAGPYPQPGAAPAVGALVASLACLVGAITLLVFLFLEGTPGQNRFGPDPKRPETHEQVFA